MQKRIFLVILAVLVISLGVLADGGRQAAAQKSERMVCTYAQMANDFFKSFDKGAREAAEALGNTYTAAPDERRPEKFMSNIQSFASAGVKMIFGYPPSIGAVIEGSKLVNREKVYWATILEIADWWTPIDGGNEYWGQFIGPDAYVDGYFGGLEMGKFLKGKGETCVLLGYPGSKAGNDRARGYKAAIKDNFPGISVIAEEYGYFVRDKGYAVTQDWIIKYGDRIKGIFGANTSMSVGAAVACKEAGLPHVYQVTTDANISNMKDLKEGNLDAVFNIYGYWMAGRQAVTVYDLRHGWRPSVPETMMSTMQSCVTRENVDWYIETFCQDRPYDYDWKKMSHVLNPNDWDPQGLLLPIYPENFTNWRYVDKPKDYNVPKQYEEAMKSGEYKRVYDLYLDKFTAAWTIPPVSSYPYNFVFVANSLGDKLRATVVRRIVGDKLVYETIDIPWHGEIKASGKE